MPVLVPDTCCFTPIGKRSEITDSMKMDHEQTVTVDDDGFFIYYRSL